MKITKYYIQKSNIMLSPMSIAISNLTYIYILKNIITRAPKYLKFLFTLGANKRALYCAISPA